MIETNNTTRLMIDLEAKSIMEIRDLGETLEIEDFQEEQNEQIGATSFFYPSKSRYSVISQLGRGGAAAVSLAVDCDTGRKVAVKRYTKIGDKGKNLCKKELQILGMLDHGGIPTIYDFGTNPLKQYYCTMRYVEGQNLRSIIRQLKKGDASAHQQFQFQDRADIIIQLLRIITSAHEKSIIHRDIKPENIMIGPGGEVTLIDWGIAKVIEPNQENSNLIGTPAYMSPEQIALEPLDERSDIYSIAVVFYELLCLNRTVPLELDVFSFLNTLKTAEVKLVDKIPHPTQGYVPSEFATIVHKGLAKNKEERYQSAQNMLMELTAIRNGDFCAVCARTIIKRNLHRFMHWLDMAPFRNVPIAILVLILFPLIFLGFGIFLGGL
jgi:eukaryotic-like serine/threonine-protein kinase